MKHESGLGGPTMIRLLFILCVLSSTCLAQGSSSPKAEIDAKASAAVARMLTPKLPTAAQAALRAEMLARAANREPSADELTKAYSAALSDEVKALKLGQGDSLSFEGLEEASRATQAEASLKGAAALPSTPAPKCSGAVRVGASEADVTCWLGRPDRVNVDVISGDQLVFAHYPDGTSRSSEMFVYIGAKTRRVEDIQYSF